MIKLLRRIADTLRSPYNPDPHRRKEVVEMLSKRPILSNAEWHIRYAKPYGISIEFTSWYRDTCSKYFVYDLRGALPEDRLVDDLGLFDATWNDVDWDIMEDFEGEFGTKLKSENLQDIRTFGELLRYAWEKSQIAKRKET